SARPCTRADPPRCGGSPVWDGGRARGWRSQEVLEVVLAADSTAEPEDLAGHGVRVDLDEVAGSVPQVACTADQLVRLVGPVALDPELFERQVDHTALHVV